MLGWTTGGLPTHLFYNGKLYKKPSELASTINNFFINKVKNLRKNLPISNGNPLDLVSKLMKNRTCKFELISVHPDQVLEIISKLKISNSCGTDSIDSYIGKVPKTH